MTGKSDDLVETYYSEGKTCEWFERLSDDEFANQLNRVAMDLCDNDCGPLESWMPIVGIVNIAKDRIGQLTVRAEAAEAEVARLREAMKGAAVITNQAASIIAEREARLVEAEKVIAPFAEISDYCPPDAGWGDEDEWEITTAMGGRIADINLSDFRAARAFQERT